VCGIYGVAGKGISNDIGIIDNTKNVLECMNFRGPDSTGIELINDVVFGHLRLSIQDLSSSGEQPMFSWNKNFLICFNGEIYNKFELLKKIKQHNEKFTLKSSSDTEILINLFEYYDPQKILHLIEGMFAFSVYDIRRNKIFCFRDRFGEKPFYYSLKNNIFTFSSNLDALCKSKFCNKEIELSSVKEYLNYNYISAPNTIYRDIYKLNPNSILEFDIETSELQIKIQKDAPITKSNLSVNKLIDLTDQKLSEAIKKQSISDAPVGLYLSGGIDSSLIFSYLKEEIKFETFTIGFDEDGYDESKNASNLADRYGIKKNTLKVRGRDLLKIKNKLLKAYDEPFGDASALPTLLLAEFAAHKVKVVIGGDGGDELFFGYNRYSIAEGYKNYFNLCPKPIKKLLGFLLDLFPLKVVNSIAQKTFLNSLVPNFDIKFSKLKKIVKCNDLNEFFNTVKSNYLDENDIPMLNATTNQRTINISDINSIINNDVNCYLADDILVKGDRANMFFSVENRAPFLDKAVYEISRIIPNEVKFNKKISKFVLKEIAKKRLEEFNGNMPKMGFTVPLNAWIKNDLKAEVMDLLDSKFIKKQNIFDYKKIHKIIFDHLNEKEDNSQKIWNLWVFQNWYKARFK